MMLTLTKSTHNLSIKGPNCKHHYYIILHMFKKEAFVINNCFSQSLFIVQLSIKLLDKMTSEFNILSEFQSFLLRYQSNVSYFEI